MNEEEKKLNALRRKVLRGAARSGRGLEMSPAHKVKYRKFLESLKKHFEVVSLKDYNKKTKKKLCLLRHDVDHTLNGALQMAEIERSMGIHSTYYMLHTARYYKKVIQRERMIGICKKIQAMGHEIGLHNNILTACLTIFRKPKSPEARLQSVLRTFRMNGIKIYGSSSHGSKLCRTLGYINYEIFEECICPWKEERKIKIGGKETEPPTNVVKLHTVKLGDFKLSYEAYFLPIDHYLSDTGGEWRAVNAFSIHDEWHPTFLELSPIGDINAFLDEFGKREDVKVVQVLTHPIYWTRPKLKP